MASSDIAKAKVPSIRRAGRELHIQPKANISATIGGGENQPLRIVTETAKPSRNRTPFRTKRELARQVYIREQCLVFCDPTMMEDGWPPAALAKEICGLCPYKRLGRWLGLMRGVRIILESAKGTYAGNSTGLHGRRPKVPS